jgi:hypothetical protein
VPLTVFVQLSGMSGPEVGILATVGVGQAAVAEVVVAERSYTGKVLETPAMELFAAKAAVTSVRYRPV